MQSSENQLTSACSRLADYLQSNKDALIGEWLAQVRTDPAVPSEPMTKVELVDHVPGIFDAAMQALRQRGNDAAMEKVQVIAARHSIFRWVQHYDLQAVLREVSLFRAVFIRYLRDFERDDQPKDSSAHLFTSTTIHRILDEVVMDATDTFLELKTRGGENDA